MEHQLIASYAYECYVSTAYRLASMETDVPVWYYETIIWEWNSKIKKRGKILEIIEGNSDEEIAINNHFEAIKKLTNIKLYNEHKKSNDKPYS